MAEEQVGLEAPVVETGAETPPEEKAEETPAVDYKAEYDKLAAEREADKARLAPMLEQWRADQAVKAEEKAKQDLQAAMSIAEEIEKASDASDEPLTVEQRTRLKSLLEAGVIYEQEAGNIAQEKTAASAIWYASRHLLGDPVKAAVVQELMQLGAELAKYGDPRLMDAHVKLLASHRQAVQATAAGQAATSRAASGVDNPPVSLTGTGNLQDGEAIGRKIADPRYGVKSLTVAEKRRYNEWRRSNNLPGVSGW